MHGKQRYVALNMLTFFALDSTCGLVLFTHLPNSAEISEVEDVMELGRRRKHFDFRLLPQLSSCRHQVLDHITNLFAKITGLHEKGCEQ